VSAPKIEDHPDHFLVHGKERPYKVFKKGMSKGTVERFQKMCSGGVVKAALGIAVPDPEGGPDMAVDEGAVNPAAFQAGQPENFQADLTPPEPTKYDSRVNASIKTDDGRSIPTNSPSEGIYSLDEQRARAAAGIQPEGDKTQDSLPQGPAVPQMHAVGESRLYREGSKEAQDAARREAQAQAEGERAQAAAYQAHQTATKAAWEEGKKVSDEMHARAKALDDAYARSEVDPEKYWKDGHSKIVAGIGILLSGIGQGVGAAGGNKMSNMAMDVLNKAVEQNINAQEFNIKKAGHAAMSAHQNANDHDVQRQAEMAHAYQMLGLQVQEIAHRTGSQTVIARGDALAAQMKQQAGIHQEQAAQRAMAAQYGNDVNAYQAAALKAQQQSALKSLPGRSAAMLAPLDQAQELVKEMKGSGGAKWGRLASTIETLQGVPGFGSGDMPETKWKLSVDLLANELGKISTGGKAGEQEAKHLRELMLAAKSSAQRQDALKNVVSYIAGQKKGVTRTLEYQGYIGAAPDAHTPQPYAEGAGQQWGQ
jgi:hypothetical protein